MSNERVLLGGPYLSVFIGGARKRRLRPGFKCQITPRRSENLRALSLGRSYSRAREPKFSRVIWAFHRCFDGPVGACKYRSAPIKAVGEFEFSEGGPAVRFKCDLEHPAPSRVKSIRRSERPRDCRAHCCDEGGVLLVCSGTSKMRDFPSHEARATGGGDVSIDPSTVS